MSSVAWHLRYGHPESHLRVRPHEPQESRHRILYSSESPRIAHLAATSTSPCGRVLQRGRALHAARRARARREPLAARVPGRRVRRGGSWPNGETGTVLRLHPALAPVKGALPSMVGKSSLCTTSRRAGRHRVRRLGPDRVFLPGPRSGRRTRRSADATGIRSRSATATRLRRSAFRSRGDQPSCSTGRGPSTPKPA